MVIKLTKICEIPIAQTTNSNYNIMYDDAFNNMFLFFMRNFLSQAFYKNIVKH